MLSRKSSLNVHFASSDLHELGALIDSVTSRTTRMDLERMICTGSGEVTARFRAR